MKSWLVLLFIGFLFGCKTSIKDKGGLSPSEALQSFKLPEGFSIELFAAEPLVADPVAMEVDENGDLYVVEMHGYPQDLSGSGLVKILTDTDKDGYPDQSRVFADHLRLPTGIMKWKKGMLVVDVPEVIYLEDTNRDGNADIRDTILTGFALTNPQHIANTPLLGIDNWIYIAHQGSIKPKVAMEFNDTGSAIRFPGIPGGTVLPRDGDGRNIRFRPDSHALEMLSGESQYGHCFDPWGHHICTSNANHLFHEVIAADYLKRNPSLLVADAIQNIPDHGDAAEVFPITINPRHELLTDVGVITSSCGVTWYQGGLFPDSFNKVSFIAEPVHNLVHADRILPKGASFTAGRVYQKSEFLASTDPWFRPVQFYIGPDGALYVIDYYREIIEHPEWMSEEVNRSGALYNGHTKGRIYRVIPKGSPPPAWCNNLVLAKAAPDQWVRQLANPNLWWRHTSQRMLMQQKSRDAINFLQQFIDTTQFAPGLVQSLWLLDYLDGMDSSRLQKALHHPVAGVRENAILIAEKNREKWPDVLPSLLSLADDPDSRVRFQLLCTLGYFHSVEAADAGRKILFRDMEDSWVQMAALSAGDEAAASLMKEAERFLSREETPGRKDFFENCAAVTGLSRKNEEIGQTLQLALAPGGASSAWWKASLLRGLRKGISQAGLPEGNYRNQFNQMASLVDEKTPAVIRSAVVELMSFFNIPGETKIKLIAKARQVAGDKTNPENFRKDALVVLKLDSSVEVFPLLESLIEPREPENIQKSALEVFSGLSPASCANFLVAGWKQLSPFVREAAMDCFFRDKSTMNILLSAVEQGSVQASAIGWQRTVWLMNEDEPEIRKRSRALLATGISDRDEVIKKYRLALESKGDPGQGLLLFKKNCSTCHQVEGKWGNAFGPDLASIRNREPQFILADILNPNRSIADKFEMWTVIKTNGEKLSGIIHSETSSTISIRDASGNEQVIPRSSIQSMESSDVSAMPAGFENSISISDMTHLLAFLKSSPASIDSLSANKK